MSFCLLVAFRGECKEFRFREAPSESPTIPSPVGMARGKALALSELLCIYPKPGMHVTKLGTQESPKN